MTQQAPLPPGTVTKAEQPYAVLEQQFAQGFRPDGTFGGYWTVTVQARDGTQFLLVVPQENYTPATVNAMAMDVVQQINDIGRLPASVK